MNIKYLQVAICNGGYRLIIILVFKIGLTPLYSTFTSVDSSFNSQRTACVRCCLPHVDQSIFMIQKKCHILMSCPLPVISVFSEGPNKISIISEKCECWKNYSKSLACLIEEDILENCKHIIIVLIIKINV